MLSDDDRRAAASALGEAERTGVPLAPLTDRWPAIEVDDAYAIQLLSVRDRLAAGEVVRGHKIGLTSGPMQRMFGVDEPDYGHLLGNMFVFEDETVPMGQLCSPRVEPEVAFVLGRPLPAPACTVADVLRATDYLLPALEIVDSRIADWKIKLPDTIADNASSGRVVLGGNATRPEAVDLRLLGVVLRRNGEIVETGAFAAVLGNPATAVAWLANKVHGFGVTLDAGHVVLAGSCTAAVSVGAGDVVRADFDGLGHVAVGFSAEAR